MRQERVKGLKREKLRVSINKKKKKDAVILKLHLVEELRISLPPKKKIS